MLYGWRKLRTKWNLVDDPAFWASQIDPRRIYMVTVGGTADDGDYSIDYYLTLPDGTVVSGTVTFTRAAAEANAAILIALMAAFEAEGDLDDYIAAAQHSGAVGLITRTYEGRELILSNPTAPEGATLRIEGDGFVDVAGEKNNITAQFSTERNAKFGNQGRVGVTYIGVDADGVPTAPGTMSATVALIDAIERGTRIAPSQPALVNESVPVTTVNPGNPEYAELAGSEAFMTRFTSIANGGSAVGVEIWVKESTI